MTQTVQYASSPVGTIEECLEDSQKAERRFYQCISWLKVWRGELTGGEFERKLARLALTDGAEAMRLAREQRARWLAYFGWKLSTCTALLDVYVCADRIERGEIAARHSSLTGGEEGDHGLLEYNAARWLERQGFRNPGGIVQPLIAQKDIALIGEDATNGAGQEVLLENYDQFQNGEPPAFVWDRQPYEPFRPDGRSPFTFLSWRLKPGINRGSEELLGFHLLAEYQKLAHFQPAAYHILPTVDGAFSQCDTGQHDQRLAQLNGDQWEHHVESNVENFHHARKCASYVALVAGWNAYTRELERFLETLNVYMQVHWAHRQGIKMVGDPLLTMAAKYNALAAVAMYRSIEDLIKSWREPQEKHFRRVEAMTQLQVGYWAKAAETRRVALLMVGQGLRVCSTDPAVQAMFSNM
jgi:hypothetical protein